LLALVVVADRCRCPFSSGEGASCSAHFQVGVGVVEESHDANLDVIPTD